MKITVTARSTNISNIAKNYICEKIKGLEKFYNNITNLNVILDVEKQRYNVETVLSAKHGNILVGHAVCKDMHTAIDTVINRIEKQLTKLKGRVRNRKSRYFDKNSIII